LNGQTANLHDLLCRSKSPVPTSEPATSLQLKAGLSRASQVIFRPPTPSPAPDSDNNMDTTDVADPDPTITIPAHTPSLPQDHAAVMEGVEGSAFMDNFEDPEAFFASEAKDKVLDDLQAATKSTHNLIKTLNLWSQQGYCLDADATDLLITELLQAVYTVYKIGLVQHAMAAGSEAQTIALHALIESLCMQAPPAAAPSPQPQPSRPGPLPCSSNATSDPAGLRCLVKKALFACFHKCPLPSDSKSFATVAVALLQPPPLEKRKGAAAAQAGLVQMAKSFPTAPTTAIVVVSSATSVAPSDLERVKAHCKWSTTHGPSWKEVVVITSLPTHWPEELVVGPLNSYLSSHGRAI
jgi:hypothetical protein